jgi:hypothetical protein
MTDDDYTRREFLKKFALLSAGTVLSATFLACRPEAVYGPGPVAPCRVSGMHFVDAQSNQVPLNGNQSVPVHTQFLIEFSTTMSRSAPTTTTLTDSNSSPVAHSKTWDNGVSPYPNHAIIVVPSSDLANNMEYTLRVGNDAYDTSGNRIEITDTATAVFRTAIA